MFSSRMNLGNGILGMRVQLRDTYSQLRFINGMGAPGALYGRPDWIGEVRIVGKTRDHVPMQVRHLVTK